METRSKEANYNINNVTNAAQLVFKKMVVEHSNKRVINKNQKPLVIALFFEKESYTYMFNFVIMG